MSASRGFTLIEQLFVLSVIIVMTMFTLPYYRLHFNNDRIENIQFCISAIINGAKAQALTTHQKVELNFSDSHISYQQNDKDIRYNLPEEAHFSHLTNVSFNENGNINQANHIVLNYKDSQYKLIFHLGSGDYYFKD